jgi:ABC-type dipeptide/oligopeptide/nickel transport system ATPase subunit
VVGPSGCGKSSLVRAGLLPVIADEPGMVDARPDVPWPRPGRRAGKGAVRRRQLRRASMVYKP